MAARVAGRAAARLAVGRGLVRSQVGRLARPTLSRRFNRRARSSLAVTTTKAGVHPSSQGTTAATAAPMIGAVMGTMVHRSRRWLVVLMFHRDLASRSRSQSPRAPCSRRLAWRAWRRPACADEPGARLSTRYNSFTRSSRVWPVTPSTAIDCSAPWSMSAAIATRPCSHDSRPPAPAGSPDTSITLCPSQGGQLLPKQLDRRLRTTSYVIKRRRSPRAYA